DYFSFTIAPSLGYRMNLSGVAAKVRLQAATNLTATWVVRSSLDNFASTLAMQSAFGSNNWDTLTNVLSVPAFTNLTAPVEFRFYIFADSQAATDFLRLDDVSFFGTTALLPAGSQSVYVNATDASASEAGSDPGEFN